MTTHGTSWASQQQIATRAKKKADMRAERGYSMVRRKKKKYTAEDLVKINVFNAEHGITRKPSLVPGVSLKSKKKKVTLPTFNLPD